MQRPPLNRMFLESYEYDAIRSMIENAIQTGLQHIVGMTGDEEFVKSRMYAERERILGLRELLNRIETEMGKDNEKFALDRDFAITIRI